MSPHRFVALLFVAAMVSSGALTQRAAAAQNETVLASRVGAFGPGGDGDSISVSISADGRYVAFESDADNLSAQDNNALTNIFVRDLAQQTTTLVSAPDGTDGSLNDSSSFFPSISADGRFVVFHSGSDNLSTQDNNAFINVFVRDLAQQTTTLVSAPDGSDGTLNDGDAADASISADGRYVAFVSGSDNLSTQDNDAFRNVFVRDLAQQTTTLASAPDGTDGTLNDGDAESPSISADGRYVAFGSTADNLSTQDNGSFLNVFVRDRITETTTLVSAPNGTDGTANNGHAFMGSISADGRYVAFTSSSDNLSTQDNDTFLNVFVRDRDTETTTLVSTPDGTDGSANNDGAFDPSISADGRYVAFMSQSDNLSTQDVDVFFNIFVRDLVQQTTTLVSAPDGTDGTGNTSGSFFPWISADGRHVAFESTSDNLSTQDNDAVSNVFVRDVLGPQPPVALSINDVAAKEGKSGTKLFTFTVSLDGVPGRTVTVDFATKNDTATVGDNDYEFTNGTLTFLPGETTKQIPVTVNGDKKREKSERFKVKIFNASGAEVDDKTGIGTIRNDDR